VAAVDRKMMEEWGDKGVQRVYDYNFSNYSIQEKAYLSVYFNSLTHVREFETFVNDGYHIKVDMSQVNAKENFNAVSVMAGILSWAIIIFAITCIILFIVNLLQSYFQKVQRNIGTFKAFGVSNRRLIGVYVLIVGCVILGAILIALSISFIAQGGLAAFGILKDGTYSYLSLWSLKTLLSIVIILVVSVATVYIVMERLLRQTPGDLIYDRQ
jgi:ABC-type antimicrobial peptide transport system permease subunit